MASSKPPLSLAIKGWGWMCTKVMCQSSAGLLSIHVWRASGVKMKKPGWYWKEKERQLRSNISERTLKKDTILYSIQILRIMAGLWEAQTGLGSWFAIYRACYCAQYKALSSDPKNPHKCGLGVVSIIPALIRCINSISGASWLARPPMSVPSGVRQGSWVIVSFTCLLEKNLECPGKRELQLKNCPDSMAYGHVCETMP